MKQVIEAMSVLGLTILIFVGIAALASLPVMLLWDWLIPKFFGLKEITWVEAWGMLVLSNFLFKNSQPTKTN